MVCPLHAAIEERPAAVILEARNAFFQARCMDSGERPLVPGDLIRRGAETCEGRAPLDRVVVKEGGSVTWAVCGDEGHFKRTLGPGEYDVTKPGAEVDELRSTEAGVCASLNLDAVLDAGVQHIRELISLEARQCASIPACPADAPQLPATINELQVLTRANAAETNGDSCAALALYRELKRRWKDAGWIDHKLAQVEFVRTLTLLGRRPATAGAVASLSIGIARYQNGQKTLDEKNLLFPANNAVLFGKYFKSAGAEVSVVTTKPGDADASPRATAARLLTAFVKLTCASGLARDAMVFISSHGHQDASKTSYIVPEDGFSGNSRITGVSVRQIQDVLRPFARTWVFVDACREPGDVAPEFRVLSQYLRSVPRPSDKPYDLVIQSAPAGGLAETAVNDAKNRCAQAKGLLRCGPREADGYGDFAYHFIDAVANRSDMGTLTGRMLRTGLTAKLARKAPDFGGLSNDDELAPLKAVPLVSQPVARGASPFVNAAFYQPPRGDATLIELRRRIRTGAPLTSDDAARMSRAAADSSPDQIEETRVTLEEAGQAVIRRYLEGDEAAPGEQWFRSGASYYRAAEALVPTSAMYRSRALFCEARLEMFRVATERDLTRRARIVSDDVMPKLWAAQRLDPEAAYTLNAMGIAHLESGQYEEARRYLSDAVRRQPDWAYPRHNLALTYMQQGRSRDAAAAFGRAIDSAPNYAYLHHDLALLYQRLNRRRDAEASYRNAESLLVKLAAKRPEDEKEWRGKRAKLYNAWGTLRAQGGDKRGAKAFYERASKLDDLPETAHNLAQLESGLARATLLRAALSKHPDHFATRAELARTLAQDGNAEGIAMLREIVRERPEFTGAWIDLGLAMTRRGDPVAAAEALSHAGEGWRARLLEAAIARARGDAKADSLKRQAEREAGADAAARKEIRAEWKRKAKPVR